MGNEGSITLLKEGILSKRICLSMGIFLLLFISAAGGFSTEPVIQEDPADILKDVNQAVVSLTAFDADKNPVGEGKAVIVSSSGLALTSYHLVSQAHSAKVYITNTKIRKHIDWDNVFHPSVKLSGVGRVDTQSAGKKPKGKACEVLGIVGVDRGLNLALIKIKSKSPPAATLCANAEFGMGDKALFVADEEAVSEGSITGHRDFCAEKKLALLSLPMPPDMSGTAIFNTNGELSGIVCALEDNSCVILPAAYAHPLIQDARPTALSRWEHEDYFRTAEGLFLKGTIYTAADNFTQALGLIEESLKLNPNIPGAQAQLGFLCGKLNQYERAAAAYQEALRHDPRDHNSAYGLGIAYIRLNRPQEAIEPLSLCIRLRPDDPDAYYNLGLACESIEQLEKAAQAYRRFVEINPGPVWTGYNQLGSVYVKLRQYDKAIGAFEKVIENDSGNLKAVYNLAHSYDQSGRYADAAPLYKKLITLNPKDAPAYNNLLFRMYDKAEDYDNAIAACMEILKAKPDSAQDQYNLGIIYLKKNDAANALAAFEKTLELQSGFDQAWYNIGLVHFREKNYPGAIEAFTRFDQHKPNNPDCLYNIGAAYLQQKKYEEALKPLQRCLELKPDNAYAHYNLGIAYYVLKDKYSAEAECQTLRGLNPELAEKLNRIINR